jgi:oligopeptide transport system substrate-binding protein
MKDRIDDKDLAAPRASRLRFALIVVAVIAAISCSEFERPRTEPFYSQTAPPQKREFRWSNGKLPKTLDPAFAAAPPESDVVRAVFEGLTETDPKTLKAVPAVALRWESSDDHTTWMFHLRRDAKWSNGERVTARDFARSWERVARLGKQVPQIRLFANIAGMDIPADLPPTVPELGNERLVTDLDAPPTNFSANLKPSPDPTGSPSVETKKDPKPETKPAIGVTVIDSTTLKVLLVRGDADFPLLVAHPVFRPVFDGGNGLKSGTLDTGIVTNGAFRIASFGTDGVTLDRSETHRDRDRIELERVRFVPQESSEKALEAYRLGEIDVVTNAHFEPLALKLLKPFEDFRQTTHGALNFYEVNQSSPPFSDRRVREALAIAIERTRLTDDEMDGSTRPAFAFLPFGAGESQAFKEDPERARALLAEAGFPKGDGFPAVRLVVNRNDVQIRVARLIAKMWERELGIRTEITSVESSEIEAVRSSGAFDLIRRGVVLPAADEVAAMLAIFAPPAEKPGFSGADPADQASPAPDRTPTNSDVDAGTQPFPEIDQRPAPVPDHAAALAQFPAIPLYFPTSYSLVKPYVTGFDINVLDAPSLRDVRIDTNWKPRRSKSGT